MDRHVFYFGDKVVSTVTTFSVITVSGIVLRALSVLTQVNLHNPHI